MSGRILATHFLECLPGISRGKLTEILGGMGGLSPYGRPSPSLREGFLLKNEVAQTFSAGAKWDPVCCLHRGCRCCRSGFVCDKQSAHARHTPPRSFNESIMVCPPRVPRQMTPYSVLVTLRTRDRCRSKTATTKSSPASTTGTFRAKLAIGRPKSTTVQHFGP